MTVYELMGRISKFLASNIRVFDGETEEVTIFQIMKPENDQTGFLVNNYCSFLSAFGDRQVKYWTIMGDCGPRVLYIDVEKEENKQSLNGEDI